MNAVVKHEAAMAAIQNIKDALLGRLRQGLDVLTIYRDVDQDGCARYIHVPQPVMHQLVMPFAFAGLQIHRDDALTEERIALAVAAVVIARRQLDRDVRQPQIFVNRDLSPRTRIPAL